MGSDEPLLGAEISVQMPAVPEPVPAATASAPQPEYFPPPYVSDTDIRAFDQARHVREVANTVMAHPLFVVFVFMTLFLTGVSAVFSVLSFVYASQIRDNTRDLMYIIK